MNAKSSTRTVFRAAALATAGFAATVTFGLLPTGNAAIGGVHPHRIVQRVDNTLHMNKSGEQAMVLGKAGVAGKIQQTVRTAIAVEAVRP